MLNCTWNAQGDMICSDEPNKTAVLKRRKPAEPFYTNPNGSPLVVEGFAQQKNVTQQLIEKQLSRPNPPKIPQLDNIITCDKTHSHADSACAPFGTTVACDDTYVFNTPTSKTPTVVAACVIPYGQY